MRVVFSLIVLSLLFCGCIGGGDEANDVASSAGESDGASSAPAAAVSTTIRQDSGGGVSEKITDIAAAIASGDSYTCTYRNEQGSSQIWIKGKKYLSTVKVEGFEVNSVSDGVWVYVWQKGQSTGNKFKLSDFEEMGDDDAENSGYQDIDDVVEAAFDVDCERGGVSDSLFVPPANIEFQDMGKMLLQMQEMTDSGESMDFCSMCDLIPDEAAKKECLSENNCAS